MPKIVKDSKSESVKLRAKATVKSLLKHQGNQTAAANELGIRKQTLRNRLIRNPYCREELRKALKKADVTVHKYARVIAEAMDAERTIAVEDNTEEAEKGDFIKITEPDHAIRLKAADSFVKAVGIATDDKSPETNLSGNHIHLHLGEKVDNDLAEDIRTQLAFFSRGQSASPA